MSRVYLHSKNNINTIIKLMLYLLIPFVFFAIYKNGIQLYLKGYNSLLGLFKPLILLFVTGLITGIFNRMFQEKFFGYRLLSNIFISLIAPPGINIILYLVLLLLLNFLTKFFKFNIVPVFMIIAILFDLVFSNQLFLNSFESSVNHNFSLFDFLIGKGPGGIGNTLMIASIFSLIILSLNINYKKQIPIMAFSTFYILAFITVLITGNLDQGLLLNNNVIFTFIFLSNVSIYTPYSRGACYIYGLSLGILTYAFYFINIDLGVYIVLCILSFIHPLQDQFIVGKNEKHLIEVL